VYVHTTSPPYPLTYVSYTSLLSSIKFQIKLRFKLQKRRSYSTLSIPPLKVPPIKRPLSRKRPSQYYRVEREESAPLNISISPMPFQSLTYTLLVLNNFRPRSLARHACDAIVTGLRVKGCASVMWRAAVRKRRRARVGEGIFDVWRLRLMGDW
jgi:hypothetical protein